jgi:hypothetical protein
LSLQPADKLASISLWLSVRGSRSSIHFDPFHNLLVVAVGVKRVSLWPPAETRRLYPLVRGAQHVAALHISADAQTSQALGGESSNHSAVDFAAPDFARHPLYADAVAQVVTLRAGDALFIPEGYWHQVDSEGTTIGVNYWHVCTQLQHLSLSAPAADAPAAARWNSSFSESLDGVMDAYFARRAFESLVADEKVMRICVAERALHCALLPAHPVDAWHLCAGGHAGCHCAGAVAG